VIKNTLILANVQKGRGISAICMAPIIRKKIAKVFPILFFTKFNKKIQLPNALQIAMYVSNLNIIVKC